MTLEKSQQHWKDHFEHFNAMKDVYKCHINTPFGKLYRRLLVFNIVLAEITTVLLQLTTVWVSSNR